MMLGKIKFGKIAIVIFLTILIWVWADLALDEDLTVYKATINVAFSPNLLVSFNGKPKVSIDKIKLKGPASKTSEVNRRLDDGSLVPDFSLNPERERMTTAGQQKLNVLDFVKRSDKIKEFGGLTVEACEPEILDVNIVELVEGSLDIECFDENGTPLVGIKSIDPSKVDMYVPADSRLKAQVKLTRTEIGQARKSGVVKIPYVLLAEGQKRQAPTSVRIKMSPEADLLSEYPITGAKLGFVLSANLVGEYDVDVTNYNDLVNFTILATEQAKQAYEVQPYQMLLYILDDDKKKGQDDEQRREVVYNFPEEFVRQNEIKLKTSQQPAKFMLIRVTPAKTPPAGAN